MSSLPSHHTHLESFAKERTGEHCLRLVAHVIRHRDHDGSPQLIAVGGPGGTGKSTFCQALAQELHSTSIVHLDDYKTPRKVRAQKNIFGAHPEANQMDLIYTHLQQLRLGHSIEKPIYDNIKGKALSTETITPSPFVLLDGEISTYEAFRHLVDLSIFIDAHWKTQLQTRINRDIDLRQYTPEKAIATFLYSNLREFPEHGAHSQNWADVRLYCHSDYQLEIISMADIHFEVLSGAFPNRIRP